MQTSALVMKSYCSNVDPFREAAKVYAIMERKRAISVELSMFIAGDATCLPCSGWSPCSSQDGGFP